PRRDEKRDAAREVDKDSRWGSRCAAPIPRPFGVCTVGPGSLVREGSMTFGRQKMVAGCGGITPGKWRNCDFCRLWRQERCYHRRRSEPPAAPALEFPP